jgi:hypothetical protein
MLFAAPPEPSVVETITAWSTLAAAVATGVSAIFIAVQIGQTRKSVETTEKTLKVAHDEFERGRALQIEAQRARIDSEMPRLTVTVESQSIQAWLPDVQSTFDPYSREPRADELKPGHTFQRRTDLETRVQVGVSIVVANDGPRRALVQLGAPYATGDDRHREVVIGVGESTKFWARRVHTVREWLDICDKWHAGEAHDVNIAEVLYIYPGDVGAIERHNILQGGSVIEHTPEEDWSVRIAEFKRPDGTAPSLNAVVQPFTREYFASRLASERI